MNEPQTARLAVKGKGAPLLALFARPLTAPLTVAIRTVEAEKKTFFPAIHPENNRKSEGNLNQPDFCLDNWVHHKVLVEWSGDEAASNHMLTLAKMSAWGFIELYAELESAILKFYRSYWEAYPQGLIRGPDFRELRHLKREAEAEDANVTAKLEWKEAWKKRLDSWHRKRLYDGLQKVFLAFCREAKLETPQSYEHTTIDSWAETIEGLALIRHLLVHGEKTVPDSLEAFSQKSYALNFSFKAGTPLQLELFHLQAFELFTHQLLTGLNLSAMQHPDACK